MSFDEFGKRCAICECCARKPRPDEDPATTWTVHPVEGIDMCPECVEAIRRTNESLNEIPSPSGDVRATTVSPAVDPCEGMAKPAAGDASDSQHGLSQAPRAPDAKRIAAAIDSLYATYKPEGVGVWLIGDKRSLGGVSPLGLLHMGRVDEFCAACERLEGMVG